MKVEIYGYQSDVYMCAPCINAKKLCELKQEKFDINMEFKSVAKRKDDKGRPVLDMVVLNELKDRLNLGSTSGMSMPQIFVNNAHVGGFVELKKFFANPVQDIQKVNHPYAE